MKRGMVAVTVRAAVAALAMMAVVIDAGATRIKHRAPAAAFAQAPAGDDPPQARNRGVEIGGGAKDHRRPPNIVLLLIDDLGWTDVGFMGGGYYETPNIDRLAAAGTVFTNAYANGPNCAPTRASLLSGQYPPRHGIYTVAPAARGPAAHRRLLVAATETRLALDIVTIAEALREHGYATASMGKWHLGGSGFLPTDQGFDLNLGGNRRGSPVGYFWPYERVTGDGDVLRIPGLREGGAEGEYLTDRLTDEAIAWMNAEAARPFFLYLSHFAVHTPIEAKPQVVRKYRSKPAIGGHGNARYAAMVESVDDSVGRILGQLDELGVADNTVVIFVSDNGGLGRVTTMAPLRGSKGMLYEGGIRVPMVVHWPGRSAAARRIDTPVISLDLYPTLLEIAGAAAPHQPLDGVSLVALLDGAAAGAGAAGGAAGAGAAPPLAFTERSLYWHFPAYLEGNASQGTWRTTPAAAMRHGDMKLIEFFEDGTLELYDLADDIGEQHDLAAARPAMVQQLHQAMRAWRDRVGAYVPTRVNPEYDPGR